MTAQLSPTPASPGFRQRDAGRAGADHRRPPVDAAPSDGDTIEFVRSTATSPSARRPQRSAASTPRPARPRRHVRFAQAHTASPASLGQRAHRAWTMSVGADVVIDQATLLTFGAFWWGLFASHGETDLFASQSVVGRCFIGAEIVVGLWLIGGASDAARQQLAQRRQKLLGPKTD